MEARKTPLFVFDVRGKHEYGHSDFGVCTDKENGFIAIIDIVEEGKEREESPLVYYSAPKMGVCLRLEITQTFGTSSDAPAIKELLRQMCEEFERQSQHSTDTNAPTRDEMLLFCDDLIRSFEVGLEVETNLQQKAMLEGSMSMMKAIKNTLD